MKRILIPLESYEYPSRPLSSKRLLNFYSEVEPSDARTAAALISTGGLSLIRTLGAGPIMAMNDDLSGRQYIVSGSHFYRLSYGDSVGIPFQIDDLGDIGVPDPTPFAVEAGVTIAVGVTAAVVCVPPRAYTCLHVPGTPLNQIGGDSFPGGASVAYMDGYFAFTNPGNSSEWFISKLLDPTMYDALDFAFSDAVPNVIRRIIGHRGDFWMIGENGFEIWYDSGDQDFPFRRQSGGVINIGCASPDSVCRLDGSVWWVALDGIIYRSQGYSALRVSTHAIEAILNGNVFGLSALAYIQGGHAFYVLTTADQRTLAYDCATKTWHERSSGVDGSGPWRIGSCMITGAVRTFGDTLSGNLYALNPRQADENGTVMMHQIVLPPLWGGTSRAFCNRLEVEMEVGGDLSPGPVLLEWSDDGGITYTGSRTMSAGTATQLRQRVYTTRLGSFHQRVFRLTTHGVTTIYAIDADITPGTGG